MFGMPWILAVQRHCPSGVLAAAVLWSLTAGATFQLFPNGLQRDTKTFDASGKAHQLKSKKEGLCMPHCCCPVSSAVASLLATVIHLL